MKRSRLRWTVGLGLGVLSVACAFVACGNEESPTSNGQTCASSTCEDADFDGSVAQETSYPVDASSGDTRQDVGNDSRPSTCEGGSPGTLDPAFADGGQLWLPFPSASATALGLQQDGKIIVAGAILVAGEQALALVRILPNGALDQSFGTNGVVTRVVGNATNVLAGVALQADGKIVAAGTTRTVGQTADFLVVRYMPDGSVDTTFGANGVARADFGQQRSAQGQSLAIYADGRILVGGYVDQNGVPSGSDFGLARFNSDGALDATFGASGRVTIDVRGTAETSGSVALVAGTKILIAGSTKEDTAQTGRYDMAVVRVSSDGNLDSTFGDAGVFVSSLGQTTSHRANHISVDGVGGILISGWSTGSAPDDFALVRVTASGALDTVLADGGLRSVDFANRTDRAATTIVQEDGRMVLVGTSGSGADLGTYGVSIARLLPTGELDPVFAAGGKLFIAPPTNSQLGANAAMVTPCHLVAVGSWASDVGGQPKSAMGVLRIHR